MLLLMPSVAHAAPADDLATALAACAAGPVHPLPTLSAKQTDALLAGDVVRILNRADSPEEPSAAVGMALLDGGLAGLWIAAQDPHTVVDADLTEFIIEQIGPDHAIWYGYYDLPRPFKDRQWVVESTNNHALAASTDGGCWEHIWVLVEDGIARVRPEVAASNPKGITEAHLDEAIFTPGNRGSWHLAPVGDKVLVSYQASSVVGGAIPDWVVAQLAMGRLESVLRDLETRATTWSPTHYNASHAPVLGGDGRAIRPWTGSVP